MMKKIKVLNIINIIIAIVLIAVDVFLCFYFKWGKKSYISTCLLLSVISLINLLFIVLKEYNAKDYDSLKFQPILWLSYIVLGVCGYYMVKILDEYPTYWWLYWISLICLAIIATIVIGILDYKDKKKIQEEANKRKPRFIVKNRK